MVMDPFSISLGVLSVMGACIRIAQAVDRIHDRRKIPKDISALFSEVADLHYVLRESWPYISHPSNTSIRRTKMDQRLIDMRLESFIVRAKDKLEELENFLVKKIFQQGRLIITNELKSVWSCIMNGKTRLDKAQDELRDIRLGISTALDMLTTSTVLNVEQMVNTLTDGQNNIISLLRENARANVHGAAQPHATDSCAPLLAPTTQNLAPYNPSVGRVASSIRSPFIAPEMTKKRPVPVQSVESENFNLQSMVYPVVRFKRSCMAWCSCRCHTPSTIRSFKALIPYIGSFTIAHRGIPYITKTCSETMCRQRASPMFSLTYHFPEMVVQRAFNVKFTLEDLAGPEVRIRLPRMITWASPVWGYASAGNIQAMENLFRNGLASPQDVSPIGGNLLQYSTSNWNAELTELLLEAGIDYRAEDDLKSSPIITAWDRALSGKLSSKDVTAVATLFKDADHLESRCFTSIHKIVLGISCNDLEAELKSSTKSIDDRDSRGRTAISWAATRGDEHKTMLLLRYQANISLPDIRGNTPLHYAPSTAIAKVLLDHGAEINSLNLEGQTPLYTACLEPTSASLVDYLLRSGADVNANDYSNQTALHASISKGKHCPFIDVLIDAGGDINAKNSSNDTPLRFAVFNNMHNLLRRMMDMEPDFSGINHYGHTFSHSIARSADAETVRILADSRPRSLIPDVETLDFERKTSLDYLNQRLAVIEQVEDQELRQAFDQLVRAYGVNETEDIMHDAYQFPEEVEAFTPDGSEIVSE